MELMTHAVFTDHPLRQISFYLTGGCFLKERNIKAHRCYQNMFIGIKK